MMPSGINAFVALGANLDDPVCQVQRAFDELATLPQTHVVRRSALYLSRPVGYADQPDFINAVVQLSTALRPRRLLTLLLEIERHHGRERAFRNSPRTLDLDILLYDGLVMDEPGLHLPHPRMHERAFVLLPLTDIAGDIAIPGHGSAARLLAVLDRAGIVRLPPSPAALSR